MKIDLLCIGRMKRGPQQELLDMYAKRMQWSVTVREFDSRKGDAISRQNEENAQLRLWLVPGAVVWAMDEKGKTPSSTELAAMLGDYQQQGRSHLQIMIGGADGLLQETRNRADFVLSFGRCTWPHQLVRVMLGEQLYRAQQILGGHPYHRDG